MEKTIQIFIASTTFHCTEEAYARLSSCLERLKAHFEHEEDKEEIMRDIESRIAEKLLEFKTDLITNDTVSGVIAEIGEVADIEGDTVSTIVDEPIEKADRRFYRDADTAVVAGVASGLAAYLNVNVVLLRILLVGSVFFGGMGILAYAILWLVVPKATTAAQKLEMQGKPVTFEAISRVVKERIEDGRTSSLLSRFMTQIRDALVRVLRFIVKVSGLLLMVGSFVAVVGLTIFLGVVLTNWGASYNDIPFRESSSSLLITIAAFSAYLAASIPLLFTFVLGFRLLRKRVILPSLAGFVLLGVWALTLTSTAVSGVKIAGDYYAYTEANPEYARVSEVQEVAPFDRIVVDSSRVRIVQGDTYEVLFEGRVRDMKNASTSLEAGVLTITTVDPDTSCIFCDHDTPDITVTVPSLTEVDVQQARVSFDDYSDDELVLTIEDGTVYGTLDVEQLTVASSNGSMRADLTAQNLILTSRGTVFTLTGTASTSALTLTESVFYGDAFVMQTATLEAENSHAELDVRGTLTRTIDEESNIFLEGQEETERGRE